MQPGKPILHGGIFNSAIKQQWFWLRGFFKTSDKSELYKNQTNTETKHRNKYVKQITRPVST